MTDCQCPKCGRLHHHLGTPPDAIRDTGHLTEALVTQLQHSVERNAKMANALKAALDYVAVGSDTKALVVQIKKALTGATDE